MTIDPSEVFYWDMSHESLHDVGTKTPRLDVGSLTDDWEFLSKVIDRPEGGAGLMLIHAAPLLRYVGEKTGK